MGDKRVIAGRCYEPGPSGRLVLCQWTLTGWERLYPDSQLFEWPDAKEEEWSRKFRIETRIGSSEDVQRWLIEQVFD